MINEDTLAKFNPDENGQGEFSKNLFGLPHTFETANVVVVPVPWDVTSSYGTGSSAGPEAIRKASLQLDLYDEGIEEAWKAGIWMANVDHEILDSSREMRQLATEHIESWEQNEVDVNRLEIINGACDWMVQTIERKSTELIEADKLVAILGGDHSTPLGLIRALAKRHDEFGILQVDAHADLRDSYQGFIHSHASIMHNALKLDQVKMLVQVAGRDYAESEHALAVNQPERIEQCTYQGLSDLRFGGGSFADWCGVVVETLPQKVYLSFDIDGLDPSLCPNTGTPVPGGLTFNEAKFLIQEVVSSGRKIIGLDLCEVTPGSDEWDANVGARVLYMICNQMALSNELL